MRGRIPSLLDLVSNFPVSRVDAVQISDLANLNVPVRLNVAFTVKNYAELIDNRLMFPLPSDEFSDYAEIFAAVERQHPLDLSYPMQMKKTIRIALPEGWTATFPQDVRLDNRFASVERQYKLEGNQIHYEINFIIKESIIPPEDYPTAKRLFDILVREDSEHTSFWRSVQNLKRKQRIGGRKSIFNVTFDQKRFYLEHII